MVERRGSVNNTLKKHLQQKAMRDASVIDDLEGIPTKNEFKELKRQRKHSCNICRFLEGKKQ